MLGQPILICAAASAGNRAAVAAVTADALDLAGIALRAERTIVDKVLDKLRPHP